jgi:hypothetical protein
MSYGLCLPRPKPRCIGVGGSRGVGVEVKIGSEIIPERRKINFHQDPPAQ